MRSPPVPHTPHIGGTLDSVKGPKRIRRGRQRAAGPGVGLGRRLRKHAVTLRNLYDRIHGRFARLGGVELELPPREAAREPPRFE